MDKNTKGLRGQALGDTTSSIKNITKPRKKSNACCCLASVLAEVNLTSYEIDTVLNAIVYLEREECHRWDCAHIAIRQAIAWLKHNGMASPAMAKWRCL